MEFFGLFRKRKIQKEEAIDEKSDTLPDINTILAGEWLSSCFRRPDSLYHTNLPCHLRDKRCKSTYGR